MRVGSARVDDLLVVGGGPAGLAVAIRARLAGLAVTVLDRARPPIDKACGEGLMPDGLARLAELGVELPGEADATPFTGIRYLDGAAVADAGFPRGAAGLGVRRTALQSAMAARAEAVGARLLWGERATGLVRGGPSEPGAGFPSLRTASGVTLTARWLVGADGLRSKVRAWAGLGDPRAGAGAAAGAASGVSGARGPRGGGRFGVRRHFRIEPWTDRVEVYWADRCEAYVTPVGRERVGVAMLWSGGTANFDALLARMPTLAARLEGAPRDSRDSRDLGCGPLAHRPRAVVRGRVALVGDASGYLDAITGEGLTLAFHQAFALVESIAALREDAAEAIPDGREPLAAYTRAHRRQRRLPEAFIRTLLAVERRPWLRHRMVRALAADPELFERLLGVHAGTLALRDLGVGGALRLAWRLAAS